jgi:DNA polymerase III delta prime subunit
MLTRLIPCDSLIINASDENKVDDIRNKVQDFCMTMGVNPLKIMFLDECLDENTVVWVLRNGTERGISIKNVNPNSDLVKSFNVDKDRIEWRPFELIFQGQQETYEIEFENGEVVVCTKTHKWYVQTPDGKVIRKKTRDLLADGDTYIMTTEADRITADAQ